MFGEDVLTAELDLRKATRGNAIHSLTRGPLQAWWKAGIESVRLIDLPQSTEPTRHAPRDGAPGLPGSN